MAFLGSIFYEEQAPKPNREGDARCEPLVARHPDAEQTGGATLPPSGTNAADPLTEVSGVVSALAALGAVFLRLAHSPRDPSRPAVED